MQPTIRTIETHYKGYHFRSRLEARWAVFFDALGTKFEYESEGYDLEEAGWYLPDFWLPELEVWVEIKPSGKGVVAEASKRCAALSHKGQRPVILIEGNPGISADGIFPDFTMTAFGGLPWDVFLEEGKEQSFDLFTHDYGTGILYFENLRQFLLIKIKEGEHIKKEDVDSLNINVLDEVGRRKALVELDRLYFRRKHGKEHSTVARDATACWGWNKRNLYISVGEYPYYSDIPSVVRDALDKARSARFEHGESG